MRNASPTVYVALTLALLFWGVSFVWTKIVLQEFTVFTLIFIRFSIASFMFWVLLRVRGHGFPRLGRKDHIKMMVLALFQPLLYFSFETLALQYTSASKTALIIATIPIVVLLLSVVFLKEKVTFLGGVTVLMSVLGVVLLVCGATDFVWSGDNMLGDVLALGAVFSAAAYMVLTRKLGQAHSALVISFMQMAYGTLYFFPLFLYDVPNFSPAGVTFQGICGVVFLTVLSSFGAFLCYNYALTKVEASQAAIFINGVPVVTVCTAWIILGERLTLLQGLGGGVVLCAVFLPHVFRLFCRRETAGV